MLIENLGFKVVTCFRNIRNDVSCGYIAARMVAKFKYNIITDQNWFGIPMFDCNYSGQKPSGLDLCTMGNIFLHIPGNQAVFLSETNCLDLIGLYSQVFHDLDRIQ